MSESRGRHVLVSGGSRGLGRAIVQALLQRGHRVSATSRSATEFTDSLGRRDDFCFVPGDVASTNDVGRVVAEAEDRFGPAWGLVNCAGIALDGVLATMQDSTLDSVLAVNLAGTLRLSRRVVRSMLKSRDGGSIVNISSIVGLRGYGGLAAYSATKAGMDGITRALARELGPRRIRVNSVAPGYLDTEMTHGLDDRQRGQIERRTPLGRLGTAEDVVGAVGFLLSDEARFVTGHVLVVDGGISA